MKTKKKELEYSSAEEFKISRNIYRFPFIANTKEWGRIEWCMELEKEKKKREGKYYIKYLYLWAKQTSDERYSGKIFQISSYAEMLYGAIEEEKYDSFLHHVWQTGFCELHKNIYFTAYPKNYHKDLVIKVDSSIMIEANFF